MQMMIIAGGKDVNETYSLSLRTRARGWARARTKTPTRTRTRTRTRARASPGPALLTSPNLKLFVLVIFACFCPSCGTASLPYMSRFALCDIGRYDKQQNEFRGLSNVFGVA